MTELYLDCEWNGARGDFISLALHNPGGEDFYEVDDFWFQDSTLFNGNTSHLAFLEPWVRNNVLTAFNKQAIPYEIIQARLTLYLAQFEDVIIYADWPYDFKHLCNFLVLNSETTKIPSKTIEKLTMKLITTPDTHISKIPHNALEDAKALYLNHLEMKNVG